MNISIARRGVLLGTVLTLVSLTAAMLGQQHEQQHERRQRQHEQHAQHGQHQQFVRAGVIDLGLRWWVRRRRTGAWC
jgi:type II secretory pathway component PulK